MIEKEHVLPETNAPILSKQEKQKWTSKSTTWKLLAVRQPPFDWRVYKFI